MSARLVLLLSVAWSQPSSSPLETKNPKQCFPRHFMFGSATAAYQVEGAITAGGREPSIWDTFCKSKPNLDCAGLADNFYHMYHSDIEQMSKMGLQSFRLSLSWSRLMSWDETAGRMVVNRAGVIFYHRVIRALKAAHIEPIITLYHWDLPEILNKKLDPPGWLSRHIIPHYLDFASAVFHHFGHATKYFATFNEPQTFLQLGYDMGIHAPGFRNSSYLAGHHVLLAHGHAVKIFRLLQMRGYVSPSAGIGMVLNLQNALPMDPVKDVIANAAERNNQFRAGWFLEPMFHGRYPDVMRESAGARLPIFTPTEARLMRGSFDLLMLNYYSTTLATKCDSPRSTIPCSALLPGFDADLGLDTSKFPEDSFTGGTDGPGGPLLCGWFRGVPGGYLEAIRWMHRQQLKAGYNVSLLLTENGFCGNATVDNPDMLRYYKMELHEVYKAVQEHIPVIGYTAWSLLDNYEWGSFKPRFGLFYIDFPSDIGKLTHRPLNNSLTRVPRPTVAWLSELAKTGCIPE
eukprot:gb/GEZN01004160.1/.p1 GENE.gb/GEZN01004160.1/~~gb/GEZN01004160.1/.p1  ORF type:complete len:533 (-),score=72.82 gb/GEZN01004160.1/:415-1962(-)